MEISKEKAEQQSAIVLNQGTHAQEPLIFGNAAAITTSGDGVLKILHTIPYELIVDTPSIPHNKPIVIPYLTPFKS